MRDVQMPIDEAGHQRRAEELRMLVVWIDALLDVVVNQQKVIRYSGLVQVLPVSSGHIDLSCGDKLVRLKGLSASLVMRAA